MIFVILSAEREEAMLPAITVQSEDTTKTMHRITARIPVKTFIAGWIFIFNSIQPEAVQI